MNRYLPEQQTGVAFHLMGRIFKLMRYIIYYSFIASDKKVEKSMKTLLMFMRNWEKEIVIW